MNKAIVSNIPIKVFLIIQITSLMGMMIISNQFSMAEMSSFLPFLTI